MRVRVAADGDADTIARLHAGSWRRHYRGAYTDAFLDDGAEADRLTVWRARFADRSGTATYLAGPEAGPDVGFVHVVLDADPRWGSLVDNLHVTDGHRHGGVGTLLLTTAAATVRERAATPALFLWVLEQNTAAQRFYRARGGVHVETVPVGGDPARLVGAPNKLRMAWPTGQITAQIS